MATQQFNNLDSLGDGRTEMLNASRKIALIDVIGSHPVFDQHMHELFHDDGAVIDAFEQDGLIPQRNTSVGQHSQRALCLWRHLGWMVKMGVNPDRMIFAQHIYQFFGYALRHDYRNTRANPDHFDMINCANAPDNYLQESVGKCQRVSARNQDIPDLLMFLDIFDRLIKLCLLDGLIMLAGKTPSGAMAAIHRADIGHQEQHPIRVAVRDVGYR